MIPALTVTRGFRVNKRWQECQEGTAGGRGTHLQALGSWPKDREREDSRLRDSLVFKKLGGSR